MPTINISSYTRPGIYINEYDNSVLQSVTAQGITNLVIGVSKTGPINAPVLIQNTTDLQNIFGGIDRGLERKGSYFQRTIAQMIKSGPVYALNLLETNDTLDKIEYAPLATATDKTNDVTQLGSYRKFYNTTGFWKLDTDAFLTLASENVDYGNRLVNFVNVSGSYITAFVFKSTATGFDISMTQWYGSVTNIPPYVYPTDYVSDYMVDVVVLAGDWSNYQVLSVDKTWSKYFDNTGLRKSQVQNFIHDRNVTLLKYYQGLSFIPYFRDSNNQNIFIETVINQDTTKTGLFCAFNSDLFDTDYPAGKIDLIGNNLVTDVSVNSSEEISLIDPNITAIDYLSYDESLIQIESYPQTLLDSVGNVTSIDPLGTFSGSTGSTKRTNNYAEDYVYGIVRGLATYSTSTASVSFTISNGAYSIVGGNLINIPNGLNVTTTFNVYKNSYAAATASYITAIKLNTNGAIESVPSYIPSSSPSVAATDIVLGYISVTISNAGSISSMTYTDLTVNTSGYVDLQYNTDYSVTSLGSNNTFVLSFSGSAAVPDTSNYKQYRRIKRFNALKSVLESVNIGESVLMMNFSDGVWVKQSLANMSVSSITSTSQNKSLTVQTNLGMTESVFSNVVNKLQSLLVYTVDNELILSDNKLLTINTLGSSNHIGASAYGVVAKYSKLYQDFYSGVINTGDYFYADIMKNTATSISFVTVTGSNYLVINGTTTPFDTSTYTQYIAPGSLYNKGVITVKSDGIHNPGYNYYTASYGFTGSNAYAILINEAITTETIVANTSIYDAATKYYLAMDIDSNNDLTVEITGSDLYSYQGNSSLSNNFNTTFNVNSYLSNYRQTVEIVIPENYTPVYNQIIVDAGRYSEVIVGDFLAAYVDPTTLVFGQKPKNLTRIISKKVYSGDTTLAVITCDAAIYKFPYGNPVSGVYQTMRYSSIDNYVSTYKAIPLKGFRIRQASLPDGTETTQSNILNLVAKGTPLYNALINKDAIDYRYLIDSFGLGLAEFSKQQLVDICGGRLNCLGFLNMPSIKQFKKSSSPSFVDSDGVLQTSYIAQGGNLESNPAFLYSFGEGEGSTCVGYFTPYLTINDNGNPLSVPPAMFAASTYMRKHTSNLTSIVPWTIAAGIQNGLITGIAGVEMNFNPQDISNLNQAQMNPIVYKKNRGWAIETENTGLTLYKSALSYLHVREVLIELENELTAMLMNFQWKFNTQDLRAEIKLRADVICAGFVAKNGLYNYFNKCDSENNTSTLIDNQIGVLDTYVEPIKGLAVIVNNITVLKTGAIQSGGFMTL